MPSSKTMKYGTLDKHEDEENQLLHGDSENLSETPEERKARLRRKMKFVFGIPLIFPMPSRRAATVTDTNTEFKYLHAPTPAYNAAPKKLFKHETGTSHKTPVFLGIALVVVGAIVDGFRPISLIWAKDGNRQYPFLFSVWVILVKVLVVLFSVLLYYLTPADQRVSELSVGKRLMLSVWLIPPSLLYVASDIINFYMFEYISASTFSVVKQCRLAIVAFLYRFFLGRVISEIQWLAVLQLVLASVLFEMKLAPPTPVAGEPGEESSQYFGIMLLLFKCLLDSLAVIWMDKYFKKLDVSGFPYCQQQILYSIYGVFVGVAFTVYNDGTKIMNYEGSVLGDFTTGAWVSAIVTGLYGLMVSLVLRYLNSMIKMIQSLLAVIVTVLMDMIFFHEEVSNLQTISMLFVFVSVYLYKLGTVTVKE